MRVSSTGNTKGGEKLPPYESFSWGHFGKGSVITPCSHIVLFISRFESALEREVSTTIRIVQMELREVVTSGGVGNRRSLSGVPVQYTTF